MKSIESAVPVSAGAADGESGPNYWLLGYSSGPRTAQHPPFLRQTKRNRKKTNLSGFKPSRKSKNLPKTQRNPGNWKTEVDRYPMLTETEKKFVPSGI